MTRCVLLVGCIALSVLMTSCFIPQKKEYVMRPDEVFKVIYPDWGVSTGCYLNFTLTKKQGGGNGKLVANEQFFADNRQIIVMEEKRESEIVYPLMMHGVPFYYYNEQIILNDSVYFDGLPSGYVNNDYFWYTYKDTTVVLLKRAGSLYTELNSRCNTYESEKSYSLDSAYQFGQLAFADSVKRHYHKSDSDTGFSIIRFLVDYDCDLSRSEYRVLEITPGYKQTVFSASTRRQLLDIVQGQKNWRRLSYGRYYVFIVFKLDNGEIVGID